MFHIFRWRRERRNANTSLDLFKDQEQKKAHARRRRLRIYQGAHSIERLLHVRRHRSPSDHDKQQVTRNKLFKI